jgi:hypothetical protein
MDVFLTDTNNLFFTISDTFLRVHCSNDISPVCMDIFGFELMSYGRDNLSF